MKIFSMAFPYFPEEDIEKILSEYKKILSGDGLLSMGGNVNCFEKEFAKYVGAKYAIVTNSCTSGLEMALRAIGVADGEVIIPAQTFIATGSCVVLAGGRVVFCETDENFLLDFNDLKQKITDCTKAVIMVHFAGLIHKDIKAIREFLNAKGIYLIEDAAHAHGAKAQNLFAGNLGDISCFSFFSTKIMSTGEGGIITTNSEEFYHICQSLCNRGVDVRSKSELFSMIGSNRRMSEFQAILGRSQLKRLEEFVSRRNHIAEIYKTVLQPLQKNGLLRFQEVPQDFRHAYWRFSVFVDGKFVDLLKLQNDLKGKGIPIDFPYTPLLHLQPAFLQNDAVPVRLPKTEQLAKQHFCLPMHVLIKDDEAYFIAETVRDLLL